MNSVAVIMSTYNGEAFVKEQIDSILAQTGVDVSLFVRDDGSSDCTKEILSEYAGKYPNVTVSFEQNVGVGNSFMNALYSVPDSFEYYAFADQDDIWEDVKLYEAIRLLQESGKVLYASNQENTDRYGNSLGMRYGADKNIHLTPVSIIACNTLAGCTMVLKNELFLRLKDEKSRPSESLLRNRIHDVWVAAVASVCGGIVYDERSFIKYRQHGNNVVGGFEDGIKEDAKSKLKKTFNKEKRNGRSKLAKELVERFDEASSFPLVGVCASKSKIKLWKNGRELRSYTKESAGGFFLKVLFGLF